MYIAIELHSPFLQKTHRFFKIVKIKNPLTVFVPYLHPENSNGRCSGTILTGNTCVTVPVIGGGVLVHTSHMYVLMANCQLTLWLTDTHKGESTITFWQTGMTE